MKASRLPSFLPSFLPFFLPSFLIITATLLLFGCKKEQEATSNPKQETPVLLKDSEDLVQVTDGVLCFLDMPTFDYYLNSLLAMPDSLRKLQEDQWGFTSYASIADSLSEIIIDASTENEMLQLISTYNDFLKIEDSTLTTQLPFMGHQCVANADGIFKVDSTYFRIFTEGIVGWIGATLTQIESLTLNEDFDDDLSDGKFFYIRNVELDPLESNCGNYHRVEKYTNNGMYRVIFEIWAKKEIYWGTKCPATNTWIEHHQYGCQIKVRSQVKRFWMWHSYKSSLEFQEVSCQLMVPRQVNYNYQNCSYIPTFELGGVYNISNSINNASFLDVWITGANNGMGDMTHNYSSLPLPVFLKVKGKGKSAALGINNWAEINCGY